MLEEDKVIKDRQNRRQEREEIQIAEDRCIHLAKVKVKLGQSLDEAEDALTLERERKSKGIVEKIKRKLEAEVDAGGRHLPGAYQSQPVPDQHAQGEVGVLHGCQVRGREDAGHVVQGQGEIKIFLGSQILLITTNIFLSL